MSNPLNENPAEKFALNKWRWRRPASLLATLIIITAGAGVWLSISTSGLRLSGSALSHLSGGNLSFEGLDGKLSETISAHTVRFARDDLLVVARGVQVRWQPGALMSGLLEITALTVADMEIVSLPSSEPESLPENLELPLAVSVHKLDIGALRVLPEKSAKPDFSAAELTAKFESDGHEHRLADLRINLEFGRLTASGQIAGARPFELGARMELAGLAIPDAPGAQEARISAIIAGNLEQLDVRAEGKGGGLTGKGEAQLRPYAPIKVAGLRLAVNGLDPHVFLPALPKASLALKADLRENAAGQLEGSLTGKNSASAPLDQGGLPLLEVHAQPVLSSALLRLDALTLVMPGGGTISGNLAWQHKQGKASADLLVSRIDPARLDTRLRPASINGTMKLSGDAKHQQGILALRDRKLQMDVVFAKTSDILMLDKMYLGHGRSALRGEGRLGLNGPRPFSFEGSLHHFDVSAFAEAPRTDLNATLKLTGELEPAQVTGPTGAVHFRMGNSHIAEQPVTGNGRIEFAGLDRATGRAGGKGEIEVRLGDNHLTARGGFGRKGDRLQLQLAAPALAQVGHGLGGSLTARALLETGFTHFEQANPALPDMSFYVKGQNLVFPGDHNLAAFAADGTVQGNAIALKLSLRDYGTKAKVLVQSLQLDVEGGSARHEVLATAHVGGDQDFTLRARGGLKKTAQQWQGWKAMQWLGELSELSAAGRFPLHLTAPAPLEASSEHLSLGTTKLAVAGGNVQISGVEWTPQKWSSKGHFSRIGLRPRADAVKGEAENHDALRLKGEWDIASATQLKGNLSVVRESGDWILPGDPPFSLGLQTLEIMAHAADGRVTGELKARGKHLGVANANIALPIVKSSNIALNWTVEPDAALGGHISVNMDDISWAGIALDDGNNLRTGGQLALQADIIGTFATPRLRGQIRGDHLTLALLDQGVRLEQGTLAARFDQESLYMDALDFTAPPLPLPDDPLLKNLKLEKGPGSLRASGVMDLTGKRGNLEIIASRLPLAQRPDRWIIASGNGHASLENNMLTLKGTLAADAGLLAQPTAGRPHLPDDVIVIGGETSERQQPERKGLRIDMEANLDLGEKFHIRASGLEGRLAGQLRLHGEPGERLRAIGSITARDTNFEAYGQRLTVERGIVNFQGPIDDPGLNILALRKGLAVQAGVEVTGTVRQPKVRLVSTPDVPDLEKLSWIALGRAPGGKADASLLLAAAGSIMGGQSGGVTEKISRALGVDELAIRQSGVDALTGQVGVVGKRLSDKAYLSYEQGLTAVAGVTKLTYNLTPKITLVTRAGIDNAIDVLYTLRFD
jgi:translocation and assembly module TamB